MLTLSGVGQPQNGGAGIEERFVIEVKTDNDGSSGDDQFTIPWIGTYDVEWGDGVTELGLIDTQTHTYSTAGTYTIKIIASSGQIFFNRLANDRRKLLNITNWGDCVWTTMNGAFKGCENLENVSATDVPDLSVCTDISNIFSLSAYYGSKTFTNLVNWDVSNVTNFQSAFEKYRRYGNTPLDVGFNIDNWDFSNATKARYAFAGICGNNGNALLTTIDVSNWDISNLTDAFSMLGSKTINILNAGSIKIGNNLQAFRTCYLADNTINNLDVSGVTNYYGAFGQCNLENVDFSTFQLQGNLRGILGGSTNIPDITNWDISNVTTLQDAFAGTQNFNQDISAWVTSSLSNLRNCFNNCDNFDQNLGNWDITNVTDFRDMMKYATGLSTANYDSTLIGWANQNVQSNESIDFGGSQYTLGGPAEAARNTLINTYGWTITDGGGMFVGVLDTYPGASAAYSLRDLASASLGSAVVRVRRSSDNTEQDFTAEEITDGTLTTFTGANDGFVAIWYDQSGNSNNLIQNSALTQLLIVISGELILNNGLPSMETNGLSNCSFGTLPNNQLAFTHESEATWSIVYNFTSIGIISRSTGNIYKSSRGLQLRSNPKPKIANGSNVDYSIEYFRGPSIKNQTVHFLWDYDLSILNMPQKTSMMENETVVQTGNASVGSGAIGSSNKPLSFNGVNNGAYGSVGKYQEWIIWDSRLDSDRAGIQSNINSYYTIY
jgi:hypothetical protein